MTKLRVNLRNYANEPKNEHMGFQIVTWSQVYQKIKFRTEKTKMYRLKHKNIRYTEDDSVCYIARLHTHAACLSAVAERHARRPWRR